MDWRVTHLSGLPHLPGVSHVHVNRPLDHVMFSREFPFGRFIKYVYVVVNFLFQVIFVFLLFFGYGNVC